jgi:hypothetical protein
LGGGLRAKGGNVVAIERCAQAGAVDLFVDLCHGDGADLNAEQAHSETLNCHCICNDSHLFSFWKGL